MPKRSSIGKCRSKALSALGFAGMSLSMASGACASTSEASANISPPSQEHEIFLGEEEISNPGYRRSSEGTMGQYKGFIAPALKADQLRDRSRSPMFLSINRAVDLS